MKALVARQRKPYQSLWRRRISRAEALALSLATVSAAGEAIDGIHLPCRLFQRQRQCDDAAAGAQIERAHGADCGACANASSTSNSVSGRGISTSGVILNMRL